MFIYNFYTSWSNISRLNQINNLENILTGIGIGVGIWLILFILQGVGIYTMAKNRNVSKKWLAFVPFANVFYMEKLVGECYMFGRKIKRLGLFAMLAQIVTTICCFGAIAAEIYLFVNYGNPELVQGYYPIWTGLTGVGDKINKLYEISGFIIAIVSLVYTISYFLLLTGLYKKYSPDNYFTLLFLSLFFNPVAPYIVVFAIRNRKAVNYEEYMRKKREEFMRRHQQYQPPYGNYPPYGTYTWGAPNGRENPYNQNTRNDEPKKPEEPFSEFSSENGNNQEDKGEDKDASTQDQDDFFN